MKALYTSMIMVFVLASCVSSTKLLQKGDYDSAIAKSAKRLMRKPTNYKQIKVLSKAYELANEQDNSQIEQLRISGQPDIWEAVFKHYSQMQSRQNLVSRLPNSVLKKIHFEAIDYNRKIAEAKNKAAAFYYANGLKLLQSNDKMAARKAYTQFEFIRKYYPNYKDVDSRIQEALAKGKNYVIFKLQNQARVALPKDFENEILKISLRSIEERWLVFDTHYDKSIDYDYSISLNLKRITVSPESIEKEKYKETKRVKDGWEYVLDNNGNVLKDSLGNDVKRTKYKTITAYIAVIKMNKKAMVSGSLDYYNNRSQQLMKTTPITSEFVFNYQYATFEGEREALSNNSIKLISNRPLAFPTNLKMIFDTSNQLKKIAYDRIKRDRYMFLN